MCSLHRLPTEIRRNGVDMSEDSDTFSGMNDLDALKIRIEAVLKTGTISERRLGRASVNDGSLVADLRAGRELRRVTVKKIEDWLDLYERDPAKALIDRPSTSDGPQQSAA